MKYPAYAPWIMNSSAFHSGKKMQGSAKVVCWVETLKTPWADYLNKT